MSIHSTGLTGCPRMPQKLALPIPWGRHEIYQVYLRIRAKVAPQYRPLIDPEHPALQKIMRRSGLLRHSFLLGDSGATVANKLRRNADLVRSGGYLHDFGKLRHPTFFAGAISGIRAGARPIKNHFELSLILNHSRASARDLQHYPDIPPEVIQLALQHHGTLVAGAQYDRSAMGELSTEQLTYHTIKPQSVEAAIVMLGDQIEADLSVIHYKKEMPVGPQLTREWLAEKTLATYQKLKAAGQFAECGERTLTWQRGEIMYTGPEMEYAAELFMWEFWKYYTGHDIVSTPEPYVKHPR